MAEVKGPGWGSVFLMGDGASPTEAFVEVAEVYRIDPISQEKPLVDTTSLTSLAKEYAGGIPDGAEFAVQCRSLLENATQNDTTGVRKKFKDNALVNFRLKPSGGATKGLSFAAVVRRISFGPFEVDTPKGFDFTLKISGDIGTYTIV